jgi:hypothetical protein
MRHLPVELPFKVAVAPCWLRLPAPAAFAQVGERTAANAFSAVALNAPWTTNTSSMGLAA